MLLYCYTPFNWVALEELLATPDSLLIRLLIEEHEQGCGFRLSTLPKDPESYEKALPRFLASSDWYASATDVDAQRVGELLERVFYTFPRQLKKPNPFKLRLSVRFPKDLKCAYFGNTVEMNLWQGWARNLAAGLVNIPGWKHPELLGRDELLTLQMNELPSTALAGRPDLTHFGSTPFRHPRFDRAKEKKTHRQRRTSGRRYYYPNYAVHTPDAVRRMHGWLEEDAAIFSRVPAQRPDVPGVDFKMFEALRITLASTAKQGGGLYVTREGQDS